MSFANGSSASNRSATSSASRGGLNASMQRCVEGSGWGVKAECFSRARVELAGDLVELRLCEL